MSRATLTIVFSLVFLSFLFLSLANNNSNQLKIRDKYNSKIQADNDELLLVIIFHIYQILQIIAVDGTLKALNKVTGDELWRTQLNMPMIGSYEYENQVQSEDAFVPLVDGSLIRFDKEGYLERTTFNVKDQDFPNNYKKDQCIVTGQTKTAAIQIDLNNGEIMQTVGADLSSFQGYKFRQEAEKQNGQQKQSDKKKEEKNSHSEKSTQIQKPEPFWLVVKSYDYLSHDNKNGSALWSIFYSEFSHTKAPPKQSTSLINSYFNPQIEQQIFTNGNLIYSVLNINRITNEIKEVPFNSFLEKEKNTVKLVNIDNFLYADHQYKYIPKHNAHAIAEQGQSTDLSLNKQNYQELKVPIKDRDPNRDYEQKMLADDKNQEQQNLEIKVKEEEEFKNRERQNEQQQQKNDSKQKPTEIDGEQQVQSKYNTLKQDLMLFILSVAFVIWILAKFKFIKIVAFKHLYKKESKDKLLTIEEKREASLTKTLPTMNEEPKEQEIIEHQEKEIKRKITVNDKVILGLGSGGTVVYEGSLNNRLVAVKRMLLQHNSIASHEIQFLQKVDLHPNVITYYDNEYDKDFVYLAFEKCEGNLENLVELMKAITQTDQQEWKVLPLANIYQQNPDELKEPYTMIQIMLQSLKGLLFLHDNNIVHRDIKPHNILINKLKIVKLSDMGLSKQLHDNQISYHTEIKGSLGWQPPEVIHSEKEHKPLKTSLQKTHKVDIFSMGCVFYYLLTMGEHPFGQRFEREKNIMNGKFNLSKIMEQLTYERSKEAANIIECMINPDPKKRPSAKQLLIHIFFWSNDKKLKLIQDVSDKLEFQNQNNNDLIMKLETIGAKYQVLRGCQNNWTLFIRNKKNHFRELPEEAKQFLGSTNDSYLKYFAKLYPTMMLAVDEYVRRNLLSDPLFAQYYDPSIII
ncbi:serine threonine-protein kinase endoribonuclease ire2 [Stylonychia lemnae]|uniref:non-specific serine/threonine protein kinase n=1 Tax=Stylonychia lemnae TaxID=5949 RepID=A0A078ADP0_STYLE|nr:serine threonine-protein kinase endoribonuclease ire2 [Stylonychia lemnae]|eukprot:CDW79003.1 serine threonine-protein kinase endoribonuclease ire2 [Stylonychia lemnae]